MWVGAEKKGESRDHPQTYHQRDQGHLRSRRVGVGAFLLRSLREKRVRGYHRWVIGLGRLWVSGHSLPVGLGLLREGFRVASAPPQVHCLLEHVLGGGVGFGGGCFDHQALC